jgi:hypothetical protein
MTAQTLTTEDPRTCPLAIGDLVRLDEFSGSRAQQALTFRVTEVKAATARSAATYSIVPTVGGKGLRAFREQLIKAESTGAVVETVDFIPTEGQTLAIKDEHITRLRGYTKGTVLVALAIKPGTVKAAVMNNATGRYWASIPLAMVRPATTEEIIAHVTKG